MNAQNGQQEARGARARAAVLLLPLIGVNGLAVAGQLVFFHGAGAPWALAVGVAAVIESVALFLSYHAHVAAMANDAAGRLRGGAYLTGIGVGVLNASHWAHHADGVVFALIFGGASALSPLLWGIHSRRAHRDQLAALGLIDARTARFSGSRWLWFPIRTLRAHRWAVWYGEGDPARAVALSGVRGPRGGAADDAPPVADVAPPETIGETTYADGVLDAAVLMAATPPTWEGMRKTEAVARADALLPRRRARQTSVALSQVGIEIAPGGVRAVRSRLRRAGANA